MTLENRSKLERAIGVLDGVSFVADGGVAAAIEFASTALEGILESEPIDALGGQTGVDGVTNGE